MTRFAAMLCAAGLLAGCADDPLSGVPRLADADLSATGGQAAIRSEPDEAGAGPALSAPPDAPSGAAAGTDDASPATTVPQRGLLGFLNRAAQGAQAPEPDSGERVAAAPPRSGGDPSPSGPFGGGRAANGVAPDAPDYRIVPLGTALPYGALARVCDAPTRRLGARIETYPDTRNTFALYDSEPGNTAPHTFYVTGFDDGCARQFTAALAMFGSPETHEQLRYGLPSQVQPHSETDAAYESLKSRICRVGRGKPCGSAMSRLARNTVFVSVYERFGSNLAWKTILLHDGKVIETDIRAN